MQTAFVQAIKQISVRSRPSFCVARSIHSSKTFNMPAKVGDQLPNVDLYEGTPGGKVNLNELGKGKKVLIFGVPGAFTPGCSKTHLPGYVESADSIKGKGISEIICVSVNDPFVMAAWGTEQKADGKVRMLADTNGALAKALDVEIDLSGPLGTVRSKRFALLAEDNVIKAIDVEPDGTGLTCSLSNNFVKNL